MRFGKTLMALFKCVLPLPLVLMVLSGCSTTRVHVFTTGAGDAEISALANKLEQSNLTFRLVPEFVGKPLDEAGAA